MTNHLLLPTLILAVLPTLATAQPVASFTELPQRLNVGDTVTVDRVDGTQTRGRLVRMTPDLLVLKTADDEVTLTGDRVRRIAVCCDSLVNGTLIGLAAGSVFGVLAARSITEHSSSIESDVIGGAIFGGVGAGLGVGLDALIRSDKTVYRALAVAAQVSLARGRHQVDVVWSW